MAVSSEYEGETWRSRLLQYSFELGKPLTQRIDAETLQRLTIMLLKTGIFNEAGPLTDPVLGIRVLGLDFESPIASAAGVDKNAEITNALWGFGFSAVEVGTVTPKPQPGNAKPRLWRLTADQAVINRFGFNNNGLETALAFLRSPKAEYARIVGVNLGRNKDTVDESSDYVRGIEATAPFADYLVINVSSPNTPGLRSLQGRDAMQRLVASAIEARSRVISVGRKPSLLVKLAPDLDEAGLADAANVALASGVDGLIMSNTTISRPPELESSNINKLGGLSGRPLFDLSTRKLADLYRMTEGRIPLIGAGGVSSGADAYAKIRAGASLVQLYSALVFEGPGLVRRIKRDLAALLTSDGFASVTDAVGADHR